MRYIILLLPIFIYADSLKSLIEYATTKNELIVAKDMSAKSKASSVESSKSNLFPTIDVGADYQRFDKPSPFRPGTRYSGYAKVGYDIYTGGKKINTINQKKNELKSSMYDYEATKKSIELAIVQDFYNIKSLEASLLARVDASNAVKAQLERMKKFFRASLATSDDVDRLQSAYDKNIYGIEQLKFEIFSLKKSLELKVGKRIETLDKSEFTKVDDAKGNELDSIKSLRATKKSILNSSEIIDSFYYPQIRVEDTYNFYGYANKPNVPGTNKLIKQRNKQNIIMATLNFRVFDYGSLAEAKEAVRLSADALNEQIVYKTKEQKLQQELAIHRIETAKLNIRSSKSALKAGENALGTITQKYNSGIVDNVVYLDALTSKTDAKAMYESSLNNLEIAYALYYYYNGKKLKEFLNE